MLEFDESNHLYRYNKSVVPSVTQVIKEVCPSNFSFVDPFVLERATRFGDYFHKATRLIDENRLDITSVDEGLVPYLEVYKKFKEEEISEILDIEVMLYDKTLNVAGTLDRIAVLKNGSKAILEYKTSSSVQKTWRLQTAGYYLLSKVDNIKRVVVKFSKDKYKIIYHEDEEDLDAFVAANIITGWRLKNNLLKLKGEDCEND